MTQTRRHRPRQLAHSPHTDVAVAVERLGLRALDHSALRLDVHELFLLEHGERDTQTQLEPDRVPHVSLRLLGHGEREAQTLTEPG